MLENTRTRLRLHRSPKGRSRFSEEQVSESIDNYIKRLAAKNLGRDLKGKTRKALVSRTLSASAHAMQSQCGSDAPYSSTRMRRSTERAFDLSAGLRPAGGLDRLHADLGTPRFI